VVDQFEIYSSDEDSLIIYVPDFRIAEFVKLAPEAELISKDINAEIKARFTAKSVDVEGYRKIDI